MFETLEKYVRFLPMLGLLAATLGTMHNYAVVATFGEDLFYVLTYIDHINSAIIAFGAINLIALVIELVSVLAFGRSVLFSALDYGNGWLLLTFLLLVLLNILLLIVGWAAYENLKGVLSFLVPTFAIIFLRRAILDRDMMAFALSFFLLSLFSIGTGIDWAFSAKRKTDSSFVLRLEKENMLAKAVKPFREFVFVVDVANNFILVKSDQVKKIDSLRNHLSFP